LGRAQNYEKEGLWEKQQILRDTVVCESNQNCEVNKGSWWIGMSYGKIRIVRKIRNYGTEQKCGKSKDLGANNELWEAQ
jgi:hypothetical protein